MRWESIGCIFQALTSALLSLPERDCFFTTQRSRRADRKHFAVEMKDCLQACITLSNYMDFLNILMVALLYRNYLVQTVITGDTSRFFLVCLDFGLDRWLMLDVIRSGVLETVGRSRQCYHSFGSSSTGAQSTCDFSIGVQKIRIFHCIWDRQ